MGRAGSGAALEVEDAEEEEGPAFAGVFRSTGPAGATGVNGTGDLCKHAPSAASCKGMQGKDRGGRGGGGQGRTHINVARACVEVQHTCHKVHDGRK